MDNNQKYKIMVSREITQIDVHAFPYPKNSCNAIREFETKINELVKEGWKVLGQTQLVKIEEKSYFLQSLIKR